jgi:hypothetical protein
VDDIPQPFSLEDLPPLASPAEIALTAHFPNGPKFVPGEPGVVCAHRLSADGLVSIGVRTEDGRIFWSATRKAFRFG